MQSTYRDIFFSTGLVGLQQAVRLVVGVAQAKIVAVLLGAAGTGSFGVFATFQNLVMSLFGLGLYGSGVRQIAAARRPDPDDVPEREVRVLLGAHAVLAALGGVAVWLLRRSISRWIFGDERSAVSIGFLAAALSAALLASGALAVLQGLRRIRALTAVHILGALAGAATAIGLVYRYREAGIAPAFLGASACLLAAVAPFLPRFRRGPRLPSLEALRTTSALVRLGSGFLASSLLGALSAFGVRALIVRRLGLDIAGFYQAAWMLATFYASTVLQAMGTDFLPRISTVAHRRDEVNRQVNEQMQAGAVILVPGILLCLVGAPLLLRALYTPEFEAAVGTARWMLAGLLVRSIVWPLTYLPMALNRPRLMTVLEAVHAAALLGFSALGLAWRGLPGAGIACFAAAAVSATAQAIAARRLTSFAPSARSRRVLGVLAPGAAVAFLLSALPPGRGAGGLAWGWTALLGLGCAAYALRLLRLRAPAAGGGPG